MATTQFQQQAQLQQPQSDFLGQVMGGAIGGGSGITTTGTDMSQYFSQQFQPISYSPIQQQQILQGWKQGTRDYGVVNFYRINEPRNSQMANSEPLDELRMKVAKWLYN